MTQFILDSIFLHLYFYLFSYSCINLRKCNQYPLSTVNLRYYTYKYISGDMYICIHMCMYTHCISSHKGPHTWSQPKSWKSNNKWNFLASWAWNSGHKHSSSVILKPLTFSTGPEPTLFLHSCLHSQIG
jgi:hypothetical protein